MNLRSVQSISQEAENLLDLVHPAPTADTDIHTFIEFKEWVNSPAFTLTTHVENASPLKKPTDSSVRTIKMRSSKSLSGDSQEPGVLLGGVKKRPTINVPILEKIEEDRANLEASYRSRSSMRSRSNSFNGEEGLEVADSNSILGSKSAKSSRSFNGYLQINQYELREEIGRGAFASVFTGIDVSSREGQKYAIKVLSNKHIRKKTLLKRGNSQAVDSQEEKEGSPRPRESLASMFVRNEVAILKKMHHPHITRLYDVIVDNAEGKVYLVLEHCGGGFINQAKQAKGEYRKLLESECKRYCKHIASALDYIHNVASIAHRDIKPENLLLSSQDQVKISDFGLGTQKVKAKQQGGTPLFMPPEANGQSEACTQAGDIWALGVTLLIMLKGKLPDFSAQKINIEGEIAELKDISEYCKAFICGCLQIDPQRRLTAEKLLSEAWLEGVDNSSGVNTEREKIEVSAREEKEVFKVKEERPAQNQIRITFE